MIVADDEVVFADGDDGVGGAADDAGVDFLLLAQFLELADQTPQKAGDGAGNELAPLWRGETGLPGRQELAVQDEIEAFRTQLRQGFNRQGGGEAGGGAVQDDVHRGVAFQGERQGYRLAEKLLPIEDDGDAHGFGGGQGHKL